MNKYNIQIITTQHCGPCIEAIKALNKFFNTNEKSKDYSTTISVGIPSDYYPIISVRCYKTGETRTQYGFKDYQDFEDFILDKPIE